MGEIYRILYNGVDDNFNETVSTLILKIAPRDLIMREKIHSRQSILQEIYMYDEVSNLLIQSKKNFKTLY